MVIDRGVNLNSVFIYLFLVCFWGFQFMYLSCMWWIFHGNSGWICGEWREDYRKQGCWGWLHSVPKSDCRPSCVQTCQGIFFHLFWLNFEVFVHYWFSCLNEFHFFSYLCRFCIFVAYGTIMYKSYPTRG